MYDLISGEVFEYSRLEKELIPFMQRMGKPLPAVCPSGLRYSLAKYEVTEIYDSYDRLLSLINTDKLIFSSPESRDESVKLNVSDIDEALAAKAFASAVNTIPTIEALCVFPKGEKASEISAKIKSDFSFIDVSVAE